jgi:hypothetical protein
LLFFAISTIGADSKWATLLRGAVVWTHGSAKYASKDDRCATLGACR